ncbi:MAG: esterase family protein [Anaerolinea sp.]|nr:esterase family protein [Anaerolinea sp.]
MKSISQNWLARAHAEGAPLVDERTATFVWQGAEPPLLRGDWNDWDEASPLSWQRVAGGRRRPTAESSWIATLELAPDAYMEYCLGVDEHRVDDPLNPRRVSNGLGQFNHWFYMPQGGPTPLARRTRGVAQGELIRLDLPTRQWVAGQQRRLILYRPAVEQPTPLLLVYDGPDYLRRASLATLVDNLIAQRRIRPIALAMLANGRGSRMAEYAGSDATLGFVHELVLPAARQQLDLIDITQEPGAFGVMGASMGGLMALATGLRLPQLFGRVLSQSGAFHLGPYPTTAVELVEQGPVRPLRIWLDVGRYEELLASNRDTHALLQARGYEVSYREFSAGHNYTAWRDDLWRGLEALFPPVN